MEDDYNEYESCVMGTVELNKWLITIEEAFERGEPVSKTKYVKIKKLYTDTLNRVKALQGFSEKHVRATKFNVNRPKFTKRR